MIELQEYLNAGFTPAQAQLLLQRDLRLQASIDSLRADMQRGFAEVIATMLAGFNGLNERMDRFEQRLGTIEESLRRPPLN